MLVHVSWHGIFWFLSGLGVVLWVAIFRLMPETLHVTQRQAFHPRNLMAGYWQLGSDPRFLLLALASGIPFNGMFLYILSAPVFLGEHLQLVPQQFFWCFLITIGGIMGGAMVSGRLAGKIAPKRQVRIGFSIMLVIALINLAANLVFKAHVSWALLPLGVFSFGWALMVPVVTLLVLDLHPERRGMASSLQMFVGSSANGIVAGVISPLVMHSTVGLAAASLLMLGVGLTSWSYIRRRWPDIGLNIAHG
jgi:DHA1 family bicyclomycin/chloramphenicol resistance-like MFS transporter